MSAEGALETSRTILTRGGTQLNETCPKKRVRGGSALEYYGERLACSAYSSTGLPSSTLITTRRLGA